jgi:hypothetical protein
MSQLLHQQGRIFLRIGGGSYLCSFTLDLHNQRVTEELQVGTAVPHSHRLGGPEWLVEAVQSSPRALAFTPHPQY